MNNAEDIIKRAFIEAQFESFPSYNYTFSDEFNNKMEKLISSQKGFLRLVNTAGKRVACLILSAVVILTSAACTIREVREPIIEEIEKFIVNAKEILTGTSADRVSQHFPTDVTKIVGTSFISKSNKQYTIENEAQVTAFIELLSKTYWGEPKDFEDFTETNTYWEFDFFNSYDRSVLKIKMCNDSTYERSKVAIIKDNVEMHYYITNKAYREILAFTNRSFYLHDSSHKIKERDFYEVLKLNALSGLSEAEQKKNKSTVRTMHYSIEKFLLNNVSLLKEDDSIYWQYVIDEKPFTDPISGYENKYTVNSTVTNGLKEMLRTVKHEKTKSKLETTLKIWENSIKNRNLEGLFKAHEYIHDMDYFMLNYPTRYVYDPYADFQGIDDYFGTLE